MRKRIYFNMLVLILLCVTLLSSSVCFVFYEVMKKQQIAAIKDRAILVAGLLSGGIDGFIDDEHDTVRITIIAPSGTVLFDNEAQSNTLENHGGRLEFKKAMETGSGESTRFSTTLSSMTYYYAIKLDDGNILRVSKTMHSIIGIFTAVLPVVIVLTVFVLLVANIIARRLTKNIVKPINNIDFEYGDGFIYDELTPFVKKIEQQKHEIAEQFLAIESRADTIKAITENMKEGLILIDKKGMILSANISSLAIFNEGGMVGKSILHICRDMNLLQKINLCLSGESSEMLFEREDRIYNVYLNPVHHGGEINGAVILFLDTTEKYEAEKQRREFSANVSHELKTPLTTISALSEMIGNGMAKEEDIESFGMKISEQTKRLIEIIDDIIRLSEFDEGNIRKEYSSFDLYDLADSVKASLQAKADERNVDLEVRGGHLQMSANKRMIDELLFNLIDNGIKYNKDGGSVTIDLSASGNFCKISITDTGIGIPKEHLARVFERFYRVDKSRSQRTGGTGLGLSIVKHIAHYHGGRVEIESNEELGTTVTCFFGIKSQNY